jgi:hypothetical protein
MSFEKYGNKLINLLSKIEHKLNPNAQIGGSDGPDTNADKTGHYVKILSYSVNHVSVLVHLERDGIVKELEDPQISYDIDGQKVEEYSIEQQLRLGCDNKGNLYKYSVVLTRYPKNEESATETTDAETSDTGTTDTKTSDTGKALGKLSGAFTNLSTAVSSQIQTLSKKT